MANLDERKQELEITKLEEEVSKIQQEKAKIVREGTWRWSLFKNVKATEWAIAIATIGILISGLATGYFSATRERLMTHGDLLKMEEIVLKANQEKLKTDIATKEAELVEVKQRLSIYVAEDLGIAELRKAYEVDIIAKVNMSPFAGDVSVIFAPAGTTPNSLISPVRNSSLTRLLLAACSIRSLREITINGFILTQTDLAIMSPKSNIKSIKFHKCAFPGKILSTTSWPPSLHYLSLSGGVIDDISSIARSETVYVLYLHSNHYFDDTLQGIAHQFPKLQKLFISGTGITDKVIPELMKVKELYLLDIRNTEFTSAGLKELRSSKILHTVYANKAIITPEIQKLYSSAERSLTIQHFETPPPPAIFEEGW